jgi:hypothetical protein
LNAEVIAVGQDLKGRQGMRLVGGPLASQTTSITLQTCSFSNIYRDTPVSAQQWDYNVVAPGFVSSVKTSGQCLNIDDCGTDIILFDCVTTGGTCCGDACYDNQVFTFTSSQTMESPLSPGLCVTGTGADSPLSLSPCVPSLPSQTFVYNNVSKTIMNPATSLCVTVGNPSVNLTNVWGRPLADGAWAISFLNVDISDRNVTCDYATCLAQTGWEPEQQLKVRDLWALQDVGVIKAGDGLSPSNPIQADGGAALYRVTPIFAP